MTQMSRNPAAGGVPQVSPIVQQAYELMQQGQLQVAARALQSALWSNPNDADAANMLGVALARQGMMDEALVWFEEAARLVPQAAGGWVNVGNIHFAKGDPAKACEYWLKGATADPDDPSAYPRLITGLYQLGRYAESADRTMEAISRQQDPTQTLNVGLPGLLTVGRAGDVVRSLRKYRDKVGPSWQVARPMLMPMLYWDEPTPEEVLKEVRDCGMMLGIMSPIDHRPFANVPDPERPLRIGYLSQDFRNQACGHFLEPLFEHADREKFQVYAYSIEEFGEDVLTERIKQHAAGFRKVQKVHDPVLLDMIRGDQIDIFVDTIVYSSPDRLTVVARKPAPIMVNYLGYPGTSGLRAMDYRLVDQVTDPAGSEHLSTEQLYRLDRCFMGYTPPSHMQDVIVRRRDAQTPPVFGSFSTLIKIQPSVIAAWCKILKAIPGSSLIVKNQSFKFDDVIERYRTQFLAHGVAPEQIRLMGHTPTREEHLRLYGEIDVALDPWPYNGMTTTFEAMWMGVPVVAWRGTQSHARVSASILQHAGFPELVAESQDEYVQKAIGLSRDVGRLVHYRTALREQMRSTVANGPAHTRAVEAFYRDIWRRWCASRAGA